MSECCTRRAEAQAVEDDLLVGLASPAGAVADDLRGRQLHRAAGGLDRLAVERDDHLADGRADAVDRAGALRLVGGHRVAGEPGDAANVAMTGSGQACELRRDRGAPGFVGCVEVDRVRRADVRTGRDERLVRGLEQQGRRALRPRAPDGPTHATTGTFDRSMARTICDGSASTAPLESSRSTSIVAPVRFALAMPSSTSDAVGGSSSPWTSTTSMPRWPGRAAGALAPASASDTPIAPAATASTAASSRAPRRRRRAGRGGSCREGRSGERRVAVAPVACGRWSSRSSAPLPGS